MPQHYSYKEIARHACKNGWGQEYESIQDGVKDLFGSPKMGAAMAMLLIERVDSLIEAVAMAYLKRRLAEIHEEMRIAINDAVKEREKEHGPCPRDVRVAYYNEMKLRLFDRLDEWGALNNKVYLSDYGPPWNCTLNQRKSYDRWMRRKIKPGAKTGGHDA